MSSTEVVAGNLSLQPLIPSVVCKWGPSIPGRLGFKLGMRPIERIKMFPYSIVISCPAHGKTLERVEKF